MDDTWMEGIGGLNFPSPILSLLCVVICLIHPFPQSITPFPRFPSHLWLPSHTCHHIFPTRPQDVDADAFLDVWFLYALICSTYDFTWLQPLWNTLFFGGYDTNADSYHFTDQRSLFIKLKPLSRRKMARLTAFETCHNNLITITSKHRLTPSPSKLRRSSRNLSCYDIPASRAIYRQNISSPPHHPRVEPCIW